MAVSIAIMVDAFREGLNKCTFRARLAVQFLIQHAVALLNGIADGLVGSDTSPERRGARTCGMPAGWGRKRCCSVRPAPRRDPGSRSEVAASRILLPDLLPRRHRRSDRRTTTACHVHANGAARLAHRTACDGPACRTVCSASRKADRRRAEMARGLETDDPACRLIWASIGREGEHGYAGAACPGGNKGDGERQPSVPVTFDGRGRHSKVLRPATAHPDLRLVNSGEQHQLACAITSRDCRSEGMILDAAVARLPA